MSKGKRFENKNNRPQKGKRFRSEKFKKIKKVLIVLLLISLIYISYYYWKSKKEQQETDNLLNTVNINSEELINSQNIITEKMLEVKALKEQYSDIVGWLEIEGTNINYPVMQCEDNDFYVDHDYKGEKSIRGSIFLDKDYDWSIPSSNLMLYGHNNSKDGTMFADLHNYKNESFYKEHPIIKFTTPEEDAEYEIIATFISKIYYKTDKNVYRWYYFINAQNEEEYNEYVDYAKENSIYYIDKTAKYGEQLITLITCEYSNEDGRLAVVARKKSLE